MMPLVSSLVLVWVVGVIVIVRVAVSAAPPELFDFVIVGGGTAGCVLANRLSQNGQFSVAVLEAGGIPPDFMDIPAFATRNEKLPEVTFQYQSVPQRRAALGNNGIVPISLGRVLGGTSNINYNLFNRGSPHDFDHWASLSGDSSWRYSNMLKYFKRAETYLGEFPSDQHGTQGPIAVGRQLYAPGREQWIEAGLELGYKIEDPNGPQTTSFTPVEFTRFSGRRVSSYGAYIKPIWGLRPNLKIILHATATQLVFEGANKAVGVKYTLEGSPFESVVFAKKEIILSAGAYGSPTILMRSGIGPREVLLSSGIPLLMELPVGSRNLQEHPVVPLHIILSDSNKSLVFDPPTDLTPQNWELYQEFGTGPYSSVLGVSGQAFLQSSAARRGGHPPTWADIHIALAAVTTRIPLFRNMSLALGETSIILYLYLGRCKSRGSVKLNPEDVNGPPRVDFGYLENQIDEDVLLEGIYATLKIFETTQAYAKVGARYSDQPVAGCGHFQFRSEPYWRCYMRQTLITGNHPAGTCVRHELGCGFNAKGLWHSKFEGSGCKHYAHHRKHQFAGCCLRDLRVSLRNNFEFLVVLIKEVGRPNWRREITSLHVFLL